MIAFLVLTDNGNSNFFIHSPSDNVEITFVIILI